MAKIETPVPGFTGDGPGDLKFVDGVGETDDPAVISYCQSAGYKVSGRAIRQPVDETKPVDSRDFADESVVGTRLRDAAVDPRPEDFLPPVNAGEEDPHGPLVVAPSIHAVGPAPIAPGVVHTDDPKEQEAKETELAKRVLVDGEPATIVATQPGEERDQGPLGLSDPGSVEVGVAQAKENAKAEAKEEKAAAATETSSKTVKKAAAKKTAAKKTARKRS